MSNLLEQIDNVLSTLNEDIRDRIYAPLINAAKTIDPTVSNVIDWGNTDNKWNELLKLVLENDQMKKSNVEYNLIVAKDAKDKNGNPINDNYVNWNFTSRTATLTNKENATILEVGGLLKNKLLSDIKKALVNDPKTQDISYSNLEVEKQQKTKVNMDVNTLIAYYFEKITNKDYNNDVPDYWKRTMTNDVSKTKQITPSQIIWFIINATKAPAIHGSNVLDILRNEKVSRIVFTLLDEDRINASMLSNISKYFILDALFAGCYDKISYQEFMQSFTTYTNMKERYAHNTSMIKDNINKYLNAKSTEDRAEIVAQNVILCFKDSDLESNALYIAANKTEYDPEFKINVIDSEDLTKYRALHSAEIKSLLQEILSEESKKQTVQYWLSIGNNSYILMPNNNKLVNLSRDAEDGIIFKSKSIVKICHSVKDGISTSDNLFIPKDIKVAVETKIPDFNINDSFEITKEGLRVKGNDFKLVGSTVVTLEVDPKTNSIVTLKLSGKPTFVSKEEASKGNSDTTNGKGSKKDYIEAISKYLKENKPQALKTDSEVDLFMNTRNSEPKFDMYRDSAINEITNNPDLYLYDKENKAIRNIKNTMLEVLIDLLNGDLDKAKEGIENKKASSHNISDNILINTNRLHSPKITSQQVADKLTALASILNQDRSNAVNKIDKRVKDQLNKDELAQLIAWFNHAFGRGNMAKIKSDAQEEGSSEE